MIIFLIGLVFGYIIGDEMGYGRGRFDGAIANKNESGGCNE